MRTLLTVLIFMFSAVNLSAQPTKKDADVMKEGKYSVKFPGEVKSETKTAGGLTLNISFGDFDKGRGGYLVIYSDMPPDKVKAPTPAQILDHGVKGLEENFKAKAKANAIEFGPKKLPAREITAEKADLSGDWNLRGTIVLVGNRLYQVYVFGAKDFTTSKEADEFLGSFTITD